jgi:hypothetical protein
MICVHHFVAIAFGGSKVPGAKARLVSDLIRRAKALRFHLY